MGLYFVTSNKNKFLEVKRLLEGVIELEQANIELMEIQAEDLEPIAEFKVKNT